MAHLRELEEENRRLKKMYADEHLKADIFKEALEKKGNSVYKGRNDQWGVEENDISIRQSCLIFHISETWYRIVRNSRMN